MDDQIAEYELACLLEEIERELLFWDPAAMGRYRADEVIEKCKRIFERARMNQIVRYPQP